MGSRGRWTLVTGTKGFVMSTTSNILFSLGGAAALVAAVPMLLPASAVIERRAVVAAEPAAIYPLIASNAGFQRFNPFRDADPDLAITLSGPATGIGSAFAFKGKDGAGTQTIVAVEENRSVTNQIDMGAMGKPTLTFTLAPVAGGTEVTWRMESQFGANPIGRVFGLFMDKLLGPVAERGLSNLSRVVTSAA